MSGRKFTFKDYKRITDAMIEQHGKEAVADFNNTFNPFDMFGLDEKLSVGEKQQVLFKTIVATLIAISLLVKGSSMKILVKALSRFFIFTVIIDFILYYVKPLILSFYNYERILATVKVIRDVGVRNEENINIDDATDEEIKETLRSIREQFKTKLDFDFEEIEIKYGDIDGYR